MNEASLDELSSFYPRVAMWFNRHQAIIQIDIEVPVES